ncbi:hypothetical protein BDW02DRAFT_246090 [Decorospora gaudefroyi]|uniref:DUF1993 domain-containing protein n=1 Tax=Decorospora gaudefroyi TaxID=184978 RepID=A0A6A5KGQ7_9PLEO|nr:hypothetical protein BDW02DRAFT_246090 [Decorospora gaudefroyi]
MSSLSFHRVALTPIIDGLKNAHHVVTKGYEHAKTNNIDPNDYLTASLHPDMRDFRFQVYRFTDAAKFIPSRLNPALESISLPDDEQTFPELLARIERTTKYLESFKESDLEGREGDEIITKYPGGKVQITQIAIDQVTRLAHPNFWFHHVTAYAILRMKGVDVGKMDYLNGANLFEIEQIEA